MGASDPALGYLRGQFDIAHTWVEGTINDVSPAVAEWIPPNRALPIGAHYAHLVFTEDLFVNQFAQGRPPLFLGEWASRTGVSEPPPPGPWDEWARRVHVDVEVMRAYARAVYAASDLYLATSDGAILDQNLDLSGLGLGERSLGWVLSIVLVNTVAHCGEISCLKGIQGLQGYPF